MNVIVKNISLPYRESSDKAIYKAKVRLKKIGITAKECSIYRRSVDARRKNNILFVYSVLCKCDCKSAERLSEIDAVVEAAGSVDICFGSERLQNRPIVCGFGPCGMFSALLLAENGYMPIVIERGSDVFERKKEVEKFYKTGILNPESNIQFGAGGAGTFSDGKLITRINDSRQRYVLARLCEFGAPSDILIKAKPHIGTDKLLFICDNIARRITMLGGEILYNTKLREIKKSGEKVVCVVTDRGEIPCGCLVLATGHSARDTYSYLQKSGYMLEPKPFSVGVRIEHLREDIDKAMYGDCAGDPILGPAEYSLSKRVGDRGVYSFCMCPGGTVVAAAGEENAVVTNGMSEYARNGVNSNSAIAVSVTSDNPMEFQRMLERNAFRLGGGGYTAPCITLGDFMNDRCKNEPKRVLPTYMNGNTRVADLQSGLPKDITEMLKIGISSFGRALKGFDSPDSVLTGFETRTSAPFRIMRNENMTAIDNDNLYPAGEGAGYAGGITSAALDGVKVALKIMERYRSYSEK